ncbi:MAG TPA: SCO family protein [Pirellulales bacterium]|nr:SCO family protein [Pirellulales bacterium]
MSNLLKGWLTLLLLLLAVYGSYSIWRMTRLISGDESSSGSHSMASEDQTAGAEPAPLPAKADRPLSDFKFIERSGEPFDLRELEGKVWVANTFFASCPGFCLQMSRKTAAIAAELAETNVTFISFTVDPVVDTPAVLREYAKNLGADPKQWLFLRGSEDDVRDLVAGRLKLPATKEHSKRLALVGRDGKLVGAYPFDDPNQVEKLKAKIRKLAAEAAPDAKEAS